MSSNEEALKHVDAYVAAKELCDSYAEDAAQERERIINLYDVPIKKDVLVSRKTGRKVEVSCCRANAKELSASDLAIVSNYLPKSRRSITIELSATFDAEDPLAEQGVNKIMQILEAAGCTVVRKKKAQIVCSPSDLTPSELKIVNKLLPPQWRFSIK